MTTAKAPKQPATPYDAEIARLESLASHPHKDKFAILGQLGLERAKKEAYHRALADLAPLHRQMVAALEGAQAHLAHPTPGAGCRAVDAALDAARKAGLS